MKNNANYGTQVMYNMKDTCIFLYTQYNQWRDLAEYDTGTSTVVCNIITSCTCIQYM